MNLSLKPTSLIALLGLASLLSACSPPVVEVTPELLQRWQQQQQDLNRLQTWELQASLTANTREDGWSARIFWKQQSDAYQLRLQGPLGQGVMRLEGNAQTVLLYADGQVYSADTPEELLEREAGIRLPVRHLMFWARGLPVPGLEIEAQDFTPEGTLSHLKQDGWEIEFRSYQQVGNRYQLSGAWLLPRKIRLENDTYLAKVGISQWLPGGMTQTPCPQDAPCR